MTNQSKKRKFLATTLTATMVAAAVAPVAGAAADNGSFPDVPADHAYAGVIADMANAGIIEGLPNGNFDLGGKITRAQAAQMVAGLLSLNVGEEANRTDFEDVKGDVWYTGAINSLVNAGVIAGISETTFAPNENITRGQLAQLLVVAYGLEDVNVDDVVLPFTDVAEDAWYTKPIKILYSEGLIDGQTPTTFGPKADMKRGDFAWLAANVDYAKGDKLPKPEDAIEAAVVSVSAINASELKVTFSAPVDKTTAIDASNYELKINNKTVDGTNGAILDIQLSADGKTATILLDQSVAAKSAFQNGDKYVIQTNNAILSKDGKKLEKFVSNEATFSETAAPALVSVAKKADNLELTFDRPVDVTGTDNVTLLKVDGIDIGSNDLKPVSPKAGTEVLGTAGDYRYTIEITDSTAKEEAKQLGEHEVVIFDVADTASDYQKVASVLTGSYTITDQVVAPEVIGIEAVNANRFFVYTNTVVTLDANSIVTVNKGTHEFQKDADQFNDTIAILDETYSDARVGSHNGKPGIWVVVSDNDGAEEENPLYRKGEASVNLTVTVEKYQADGLIGKKSVQNVTLNKNDTKPTVDTTSIAPNEEALIVKFENDLVDLNGTDLVTLDATDYIVRDNDGVIQESFTATVSGKEVTLAKVGTKLEDAPYTVEFKADKFKNKEERTNVTGYIANTVKNEKIIVPVGKEADSNFKYTEYVFDETPVTGNTTVDTDENTITFKFDKKMGDSARDVANYTLDGKALPAGTTADFVGDKQTVRVVFPEGTFKTSTKYKFGVTTNVKTEEGSMIVGSLQTKAPAELVFDVTDNVKPELASAAYYVGTEEPNNQTTTNQIEVTFSEAVHTESTLANAADDFKVTINGSDFEVASVANTGIVGSTKTDHKFVLTLKEEVNISQAATIAIVPEADQEDGEMGILDDAENKAKEGSTITLSANNWKFSSALAAAYEANQAIATDADALTISVTGGSLGTLPTTGTNGTTIAWATSDASIVTATGAFAGEGTAVLTATVSKASGSDIEVKFEVTTDATEIVSVTKQ